LEQKTGSLENCIPTTNPEVLLPKKKIMNRGGKEGRVDRGGDWEWYQ